MEIIRVRSAEGKDHCDPKMLLGWHFRTSHEVQGFSDALLMVDQRATQGFNRDWKQFVQNHVTKIRRLVPVHCWRHCPGKENPADVQSIGILPHELKYNSLWWNGPQ